MKDVIRHLEIHPLRDMLYDELHSRPFQVIPSPARITHIALQVNEQQKQEQFLHLQKLHELLGYEIPGQETHCYEQTFGDLRIRWEKHLEFTSYTFINLAPQAQQDPFSEQGISVLPAGWLEQLPGTVIAAFHIAIEDAREVQEPEPNEVKPWFEQMRLIGSSPQNGDARVWTTFRLHSDGFGRFLMYNKRMSDSQLGRLVQRLVEIETYRLMTLLALPEARRTSPVLSDMDTQLAQITEALAENGTEDEGALLSELTEMAARIEAFRAQTTFRFSASRAYADLISSRLDELREDEVSGHLTINEFLGRRLLPAVRTCNTVGERLEDLSRRVDRVSDMMRTRVEMAIQHQNRELLSSMDKRSKIQLMMQHTVEGLSVAAISYYLVGLVKYLLEALYGAGVAFDKAVATGIMVPIVLLAVWLATRRIHHHFHTLAESELPEVQARKKRNERRKRD
ncbi:DUF3422 domain-containing protein [Marinobacterium sp. D7]|uniref:DUF3422 family protein n=1 Tax=Marinobacterium ramblicola TaxID=2849041 RepID=UPI001C2D2156|nr:DUF3422 domain-containing protein [Marinobacterium ramblicola]MBV1789636.1 DUF3422 domain-containing protein [Marinobacterium ramblicola]